MNQQIGEKVMNQSDWKDIQPGINSVLMILGSFPLLEYAFYSHGVYLSVFAFGMGVVIFVVGIVLSVLTMKTDMANAKCKFLAVIGFVGAGLVLWISVAAWLDEKSFRQLLT